MLRLAGVQAVAFARDGRLALLHGRNVFVYGPSEAGNVFTRSGPARGGRVVAERALARDRRFPPPTSGSSSAGGVCGPS